MRERDCSQHNWEARIEKDGHEGPDCFVKNSARIITYVFLHSHNDCAQRVLSFATQHAMFGDAGKLYTLRKSSTHTALLRVLDRCY